MLYILSSLGSPHNAMHSPSTNTNANSEGHHHAPAAIRHVTIRQAYATAVQLISDLTDDMIHRRFVSVFSGTSRYGMYTCIIYMHVLINVLYAPLCTVYCLHLYWLLYTTACGNDLYMFVMPDCIYFEGVIIIRYASSGLFLYVTAQ